MILILDIDETLVHSHDDPVDDVDTFEVLDYYVEKRPHLDFFLTNALSDPYYKVGIWSAGTYDYVWDIVNTLIPDISRLEFVLTRDDCSITTVDGKKDHIKPLSTVSNMYKENGYNISVHDLLLIDNKPKVTTDCLRHILVDDFVGYNPDDAVLMNLWYYLDDNRGMESEWLAANWM